MPRVIVQAAEDLIGEIIPCLDKGHVMLVDYMGGDASVVQAARVSYAKDLAPFDVVEDGKLINFLMAHNHATPFEMVQLKIRMKLPIFVARQWIRHRTASVNEVSARYTQLPDDFYVPEVDAIQAQALNNKQGRAEDGSFSTEQKEWAQQKFAGEQIDAYGNYDRRVTDGMAKELARINLPVSIYTEWYWCQSLRNMLHLLGLRMDSHAQYEIRVYADAIWQIVQAVAPISAAAWEEHFFKSTRFSSTEMQILMAHIGGFDGVAKGGLGAVENQVLEEKLGKRGVQEFLAKLRRV